MVFTVYFQICLQNCRPTDEIKNISNNNMQMTYSIKQKYSCTNKDTKLTKNENPQKMVDGLHGKCNIRQLNQ